MCKRINFEPFAYAFQGHAKATTRRLFSRGFPGYALTVCRGEPQKAKRFCNNPKEAILCFFWSALQRDQETQNSSPFWEGKVWYFFCWQSFLSASRKGIL
jgi:hypothetical protein